MAKSTAHANAVLDALGDMTLHQATWISLHTGDPGTTGANEVNGGNYARVQVNAQGGASPAWGTASNRQMTNSGAVTFPQGGGDAQVTHFGIWDAQNGGNFIRGGTCTNFTYAANVTPEFANGAITLTES